MYRYVVEQETCVIYDALNTSVGYASNQTQAHRIVLRLNEPLEQLEKYSAELHLSRPITLDRLIESHRTIREARRALEKDSHEAFEDARKRARDFQEQAISHEYISFEKLKTMTMLEIANLIYEE